MMNQAKTTGCGPRPRTVQFFRAPPRPSHGRLGLISVLTLWLVGGLGSAAFAQDRAPITLTYQGTLTNAVGAPITADKRRVSNSGLP